MVPISGLSSLLSSSDIREHYLMKVASTLVYLLFIRLNVGNKHIIAMMMLILRRLLTPSLQMHHIISRGLKVWVR